MTDAWDVINAFARLAADRESQSEALAKTEAAIATLLDKVEKVFELIGPGELIAVSTGHSTKLYAWDEASGHPRCVKSHNALELKLEEAEPAVEPATLDLDYKPNHSNLIPF